MRDDDCVLNYSGTFPRYLNLATGLTIDSTESYTHSHNVLSSTIYNSGGGQAHNNLQPYLVVNFIIKY